MKHKVKYPLTNHKCRNCIHRIMKDGLEYCSRNHFYPNEKVIAFYGCYDYKGLQLDLFNQGKEEDNGEKS